MSRERFIDPGIWRSESFHALSLGARLTWIGLISTADDHGRGRGSPGSIRLEIWPGGDAEIGQVEGWLEEIKQQGLARFYQVNSSTYYDIPNWNRYQHPRYRAQSKIPGYGESAQNPYKSVQSPYKPTAGEGRGVVGCGGEGGGVTLSLNQSAAKDGTRERDSATPERTDDNKEDVETAWQRAEAELPKHQPKVKNPKAYVFKCRKEGATHPRECFDWFDQADTTEPEAVTKESVQEMIRNFKLKGGGRV